MAAAGESAYLYETGSIVHSVEATIRAASPNTNFQVCVRMIDQYNYIGLRPNSSSTRVECFQRVGGAYTSLFFTTTVDGTHLADNYRLESRADDTVAVYCENTLMGTAVVPVGLTGATKVGMGNHAGTIANAVGPFTIYTGPILHGYAATGAWCWFNDPRAIAANGKTWVGFTAVDPPNPPYGSIRVLQIDHATGVSSVYTLITGYNWGDDHNNPGLLIRPDGRLVAFYCQHSDVNGIRYRVSVNPYDATAFGAENICAVPVVGGVCYPSPLILSGEANKAYLFFRDGDSNTSAITSTDLATVAAPASNGAAQTAATWSAMQVFVPNPGDYISKGIYTRISNDGAARIDIAATFAFQSAGGTKIDVRHLFYQGGVINTSSGRDLGRKSGFGTSRTTTFTAASASTVIVVASATGLVVGMPALANGFIKSGAVITNIAGTSITLSQPTSAIASGASVSFLHYAFGTMTAVATSGTPDNLGDIWIHDLVRDASSGYVYAAFVQFLSATQHQYWYAVWNGVTWTKTPIPGALTGSLTPAATTPESYYSPGMALDPMIPGLVYVSLGNAEGTQCRLYRMITPDGGLTWTQESMNPPDILGGTYVGQNFRPYVPRNRDKRAGVVWLRGRYNFYNTGNDPANAGDPFGGYHSEIMSAKV